MNFAPYLPYFTPEAQLKLQEKEHSNVVAPYSKSYGRTDIARILKASDGGISLVGRQVYLPLCVHTRSLLWSDVDWLQGPEDRWMG